MDRAEERRRGAASGGPRPVGGVAAAEALARLYTASHLFVNCFQPSFKLAAKTREGARVSKRYHAPETPCARLLASPAIPDRTKDRLRAIVATLDPLRLLDEIRTVQHHFAGLAAGERVHVLPHRDADLHQFHSVGPARTPSHVHDFGRYDERARG